MPLDTIKNPVYAKALKTKFRMESGVPAASVDLARIDEATRGNRLGAGAVNGRRLEICKDREAAYLFDIGILGACRQRVGSCLVFRSIAPLG